MTIRLNVRPRRAVQAALAQFPNLYVRLLRVLRRGSIEKQAYLTLIRPGDIVFDIGANVGYFTVLFSDMIGASGEVHAFEPVTPTFERLEKRVRLESRFSNVRLTCAACSDEEGAATMFVPGEDWGQAALVHHQAGSWHSASRVTEYPVRLLRLDDYVAALTRRRVDFMKIDVEGAELQVLRGMRMMLSTLRPLLCLEVYGEWTRGFAHDAHAVIRLLESMGYDWFVALSDPPKAVSAAEAIQAAGREPVNLLCATRSMHATRVRRFVRGTGGRE